MVEGPMDRYEAGLWDGNERQLRLRRDAPWFPDRPSDVALPHGPEDKPAPAIYQLSASDSLLWVLASVADERWRDADYWDSDGRFDEILEVIDLRTNTVVGSQRFDRAFTNLIEPGLIGRVDITGNGSVRFRVFRVVREAAGRQGSAR